MHFLIATAALLSAATLASAKPLIDNPLFDITIGCPSPPPGITCKIIGQAPVIVRTCPSRECAEIKKYSPGDMVKFNCYYTGTEVNNPYDKITNSYWDYSDDGFFPDVYVERECSDTILNECKVTW